MKGIHKILGILVILILGSCSGEEVQIIPEESETGSIYFSGILKELTATTKFQSNAIDAEIPQCKENDTPEFVRIALRKNDGETDPENYNWVEDNDGDADYFIDIPVVPIARDNDGDGQANYLTMESSELALLEGEYSLEYFAVFNSDNEIIMMAPRKDQEYGPAEFQHFVKEALPISFKITKGTKHYLELETLCYDEVFAYAYGYLFFDFEQVNLTNLCIFGNVCDAEQIHLPAHYRFKVWEYDQEHQTKGRELINRTNNVDFSSSDPNNHSADVLCIPLPDRDGTDYYYGEIYLLKNGGETLIRYGVFTDTEIQTLYNEEDNKYTPYHFRESCCGELQDTPLLFEYVNEPVVECEPDIVANTKLN